MPTNYLARTVREIEEHARFSEDRIECLRVAGLLREHLPINHPMHEEMPELPEA